MEYWSSATLDKLSYKILIFRIRYTSFAGTGIPVPAKFHFFACIPYRDFTLNLVIKTCQKIKNFQQKFDEKLWLWVLVDYILTAEYKY